MTATRYHDYEMFEEDFKKINIKSKIHYEIEFKCKFKCLINNITNKKDEFKQRNTN